MKIGFFTAGFIRYPLEKAFKTAHECGYDGVELLGKRPHAFAFDLAAGDIKKVKQLSKDYEQPIIGYDPENAGYPYSLVFTDKRMNDDSMEYYKVSLEMAKEMNAGFMLLAANHPGYGIPLEESKKLFIDNMHVLAELAEKLDQTIVLEAVTQYEGPIMTRADDLVWALKELNSPKVKGMLDLVPPLTMFEPVEDYFTKLGSDLMHIHFVDGQDGSESHLIPGDGSLPFDQLVPLLREYGYDGYCTVELFTRYMREPVLHARRAIEAVRRYADK